MNNKMITALYCRTATACDIGIAAQENILRNYAHEHGYGNVEVYADNGYNGLDYNRPAFARMQADIKDGNIKAVLVKDFSRISRSVVGLCGWISSDGLSGVQVVSVADDCGGKGGGTFDRLMAQFGVSELK